MVAPNTRTRPSIVQFAVGRDPDLGSSATELDHIFEREGALGEVQIEIQNHSRTENLVLELETSANNLDGGYTTRQIRVAGSLVNTITVPPLARGTAVVDGPNNSDAQKYWRFRASNQQRAYGTVTVAHSGGNLERRVLFPG
jgi:hypothetical protein